MLFSIVSAPIYVPINSAGGFLFSTSSPALVISCLFDDSRSDRLEDLIFHLPFNIIYEKKSLLLLIIWKVA